MSSWEEKVGGVRKFARANLTKRSEVVRYSNGRRKKYALLTQLVECLLDVEKVSGSSPLQRTNKAEKHTRSGMLFALLRCNGLANRFCEANAVRKFGACQT